MSAMFRCIIGLCVVLCFMQYIEMARIPRDDDAVQKPTSDLAVGLQSLLDDITEKLKAVVADDSLKKWFDEFGKEVSGSNKAIEPKN